MSVGLWYDTLMQRSIIWTFFASLSVGIESILEVWVIDWMSCEHDSFFMNIDCGSRVWFGIDEHDSCSMNADCDTKTWFVIWDDLYSMNIDHSRVE